VKIHPSIWVILVFNLLPIAILYFSSGQNAALWWVAISGLMFSIIVFNNVLHLEEDKPSNYEHDRKIDEQVEKASEQYWERLRTLKAEKKKLPKIETWHIDTIPDWEQYLIKEGENLRGLLNDVWLRRVDPQVPMDYYLAHSLAELAHLKNDIATKETEWTIKKIEVTGLMRQQASFSSIIDGERELRWIENEIAEIEQRLQSIKREIWERHAA
jgi:hypothetical protein